MKRLTGFLLAVVICGQLAAQATSEATVIAAALENDPTLQIALLDVAQNKAMERTAFNPDQPDFSIEFPGDVGIGFEAEQTIAFPTVYTTRSKWLRSQTFLAESASTITRQQRVRDVRLVYLDAQINKLQITNYSYLDSLWLEISDKSKALFEGGEINKADMLYAEQQFTINRFSLSQAVTEYKNNLTTLRLYSGLDIKDVTSVEPYVDIQIDTAGNFYFQEYQQRQVQVADDAIRMKQAERLPGITVGYLKVPDLDTEFRYRYKAGITVPIWQAQYSGAIEAAKVEKEKINSSIALDIRNAQIAREQWVRRLQQTNDALQFYEQTALPQLNELITTYRRLYEGGETNYALTLKNITDVVSAREQYVSILQRRQESIIQLEFLKRNQE